MKRGVSTREGFTWTYKHFLKYISVWCPEKAIQQVLKVILLIFIFIKNIEKLNISENHQMRVPLLTRIIHAIRLRHYAIKNQGTGRVALAQTIVFNICGSRICLIKKKSETKVYILKLYWVFLYSFCFLMSLQSLAIWPSMFESSSIANHCSITVVSLYKVKKGHSVG